jgi:SAM-dependent methyltransferase
MPNSSSSKRKLHLGCGTIILPDYVNVDLLPLPGIDVVHDLAVLPWPFEDGQFDEVIAIDIIEHLPSVVKTMEEIHRITKPNAKVIIRTPYYNSWDATADPTHLHFFNENSFDVFDPQTPMGKSRNYYSNASFRIVGIGYLLYFHGSSVMVCDNYRPLDPSHLPEQYRKKALHSTTLKNILAYAAHSIGNVIRTLHIELIRS